MAFKDGTVPDPHHYHHHHHTTPPHTILHGPTFSSCQATTPTQLHIQKPSLILTVVNQYIAALTPPMAVNFHDASLPMCAVMLQRIQQPPWSPTFLSKSKSNNKKTLFAKLLRSEAPSSDPYICWSYLWSHHPTNAALVTYRRLWIGGITGSTMGTTGGGRGGGWWGVFCCGNLLHAHWAHNVTRLIPHNINTEELAAVVIAAQG